MGRSGSNNKNVNYLDLNIDITSDGLSVSIYNKTDDFNFHVVSLTFPHGNISMEIGYNVSSVRFFDMVTSVPILTALPSISTTDNQLNN